MSKVDRIAQSDSMKALTVIFIILISLASLGLLIKIVAQRAVVFTVQRLMVTFLTLGTLLCALFSLVVSARRLFSNSLNINCRDRITSGIYGAYYLPFVYAVGIMMLAVELFIRRSQLEHPRPAIRLVYISIPWLLGLLLVLPLTMAGIEWENHCRSNFTVSRFRATTIICNLIPSVCVIFTAVVLRLKINSNSQSTTNTAQATTPMAHSAPAYNQASYHTSASGGVVLAPPHQQQEHSMLKVGQYQLNDHQVNSLPPQYHTIIPSAPQMYQHHNQGQPIYNPPHPGYAPPPNYAPPPPGFGTPYYSNPAPPTLVSQPPVVTLPSTNTTEDLRKETGAILAASIIFFVCTFPYCVFLLAYAYNRDAERLDELEDTILNDVIYWVTVLRWFLLCIGWSKYLK